MKLIQALPGRMRFEAKAASSIELCVADWVSGSRYRQDTTVFAEPGEAPLTNVNLFRVAPARRFASWRLAVTIRRQVRLHGYQLIVVQQHIPLAARIAAFNPGVPVILQTHNFIPRPHSGVGSSLYNAVRYRELGSLAGITLVSEATLRRFESDWPKLAIPHRVISNGFDFSSWNPSAKRSKTVIIVGRAHETKGILEAAEGVRLLLETFRDWRAVFVLSHTEDQPAYFSSVVDALKPLKDQTEILVNVSFGQVKQVTEQAAISIVASKWEEPFGRTALEAHAGGAALISSQTGGLREISGDSAAYLNEVTGPAIGSMLLRLASDDALRETMSREGMQRVRRLFPLARTSTEMASDVIPICEQLDQFYEEIVELHAKVAGVRKGRDSRAT